MKFLLSLSFYLVLTLALFFNYGVSGASDTHRKATQKLFDTMEMDALLSGSIETMLKMQISQNPALKPFESTMRAFFSKYMSGESLREPFVAIYMETFTEKEIHEINAFYSTPTGRKTLKQTPALMAKAARIGEQRVQQNLPELELMIREEAARIQAMQQLSE